MSFCKWRTESIADACRRLQTLADADLVRVGAKIARPSGASLRTYGSEVTRRVVPHERLVPNFWQVEAALEERTLADPSLGQ